MRHAFSINMNFPKEHGASSNAAQGNVSGHKRRLEIREDPERSTDKPRTYIPRDRPTLLPAPIVHIAHPTEPKETKDSGMDAFVIFNDILSFLSRFTTLKQLRFFPNGTSETPEADTESLLPAMLTLTPGVIAHAFIWGTQPKSSPRSKPKRTLVQLMEDTDVETTPMKAWAIIRWFRIGRPETAVNSAEKSKQTAPRNVGSALSDTVFSTLDKNTLTLKVLFVEALCSHPEFPGAGEQLLRKLYQLAQLAASFSEPVCLALDPVHKRMASVYRRMNLNPDADTRTGSPAVSLKPVSNAMWTRYMALLVTSHELKPKIGFQCPMYTSLTPNSFAKGLGFYKPIIQVCTKFAEALDKIQANVTMTEDEQAWAFADVISSTLLQQQSNIETYKASYPKQLACVQFTRPIAHVRRLSSVALAHILEDNNATFADRFEKMFAKVPEYAMSRIDLCNAKKTSSTRPLESHPHRTAPDEHEEGPLVAV